MSFLLRLLGFECNHRDGWPQRHADGKDWQTCAKCGRERVSPTQFP